MTVPNSWDWVRLGDLGVEVRESVRPDDETLYALYSVPAFASGQPQVLTGSGIGSAKRRVRPGDLLICKINPRINRVWHVSHSITGVGQLASSEYLVFRLHRQNENLLRYLVWYLRSPAFRRWIELNVSGATGSHTRAKSGPILNQEVPLPPPDQRTSLVDEIEKQVTRLDAATEAMIDVRSRLSVYRMAALMAACRGRFNGNAPAEGDTGLPRDWSLAKLDELAEDIRYGTSSKANTDPDGVPVLRMGNVVDGRLKLRDLKYLPKEQLDGTGLLLEKGDVLFNRTNSRELVGKAAVYRGIPQPCSFASYLIRVRLTRRYKPELLTYFLNGPLGRHWALSVVSQQVGQANISGSKLRALQVPVPPLQEQEQLIAETERQLSLADEVDKQVESGLARSAQLRETILGRAFSGQLLTQPA